MKIALVGERGAGKGTVVSYLIERYGYKTKKLSDVIREEFALGKVVMTKILQDRGDELRKKRGGQVLVQLAYEELVRSGVKHMVIDGVRNPMEVEYLKKVGFVVIGIVADYELRMRRLRARELAGEDLRTDRMTMEAIKRVERRDKGEKQPKYGQQVAKCLAMVDKTIANNGTRRAFERKIEKMLGQLYIEREEGFMALE